MNCLVEVAPDMVAGEPLYKVALLLDQWAACVVPIKGRANFIDNLHYANPFRVNMQLGAKEKVAEAIHSSEINDSVVDRGF
jgi:hypothetical protein